MAKELQQRCLIQCGSENRFTLWLIFITANNPETTFQGCIYISIYKSLWLGDLKFHHKILVNVTTGQGHFSSFNVIMKYLAYDIGDLEVDSK